VRGLAFALILCSAAFSQAQAQTVRNWIDVHVHLVAGRGPQADFGAAISAALAAMDESGVRTSVIMPPPQIKGMPVYDWRDYTAFLARYPGRFAFLGGGGTLNVMLHDPANAQVDAAQRATFESIANEILAAGAAGFGEIAAHHLSMMQNHPYEWVAPDHPLLLLLADIAARGDAVIDLHLDLVMRDSPPPARFRATNPDTLRENFAAFERLLAHNRRAKIVWAHAGSHPLPGLVPGLARDLLARHPNLYMSLRLPARMPLNPQGGGPFKALPHLIVSPGGEIDPDWLRVLAEFHDRFVIGSDQFMANPQLSAYGPGLEFARFNAHARGLIRRFLDQLPADLARRISMENPGRLYRIGAAQ